MNTLKFLNDAMIDPEVGEIEALELLKEWYGIKYSLFPDYGLVVLNYCQIESSKHKFHPIVKECRSLVITYPGYGTEDFRVVSRSFDRFYNHGETDLDLFCPELTAYEKMDGSLIGIFYHNGEWLYRTRSVIMPDSEVNGLDVTWEELLEPLISWPMLYALTDDLKGNTLVCEVVSPANRVVVRYNKPALRLLAVRSNHNSLAYWEEEETNTLAFDLDIERPRKYTFDTFEEAQQAANDLPNLEEGFVFYNEWDEPVLKIKNQAYVAAHHLRGEGVLNSKRICDLIIMGETDEYLSVFPEDKEFFKDYLVAYNKIFNDVSWVFHECHIKCKSQKDYAMAVKDSPYASLLFSIRRGLTYSEAWDKLTQSAKRKMILAGVSNLD